MLAVHWAPVSKTKTILKNGIRKSKNGLFCFPLTGHKSLDRWWIYYFNQCRTRRRAKYNGFVFRMMPQDFPAYFGPWIGLNNKTLKKDVKKEITSIKQLGMEFRETLMWRLGELLAYEKKIGPVELAEWDKFYLGLAEQELKKSPKALIDKLNNLNFMTYTLEDYQVVLTHSIPAARIMKILPQGDEFGRVLRRQKKAKWPPLENEW
ncbi:MAG: hypothetical protein FWD61_16460 [Phycisphaerales bacterium]|nr:hypothetical protein [Phycisphaerales bacterium]